MSGNKNIPKGNYGKVLPPVLHWDSELPSCVYKQWKAAFFDFTKRHNMPTMDALSFLKDSSIAIKKYRDLISTCETVTSVFQLLDIFFGDKHNELRIIKRNIIQVPMLSMDYSYTSQLNAIQYISKYLVLFNRLFSPRERLETEEIRQSILGWLPKTHTSEIMKHLGSMTRDLTDYNIPMSESYYQILLQETGNLSSLRSDEQAKNEYANLVNVKFPTLQITSQHPTEQENLELHQDTYPINYTKNNIPQKGKDKLIKEDKTSNPILKCPLCGQNHPAHRCVELRNLRDGKIKVPDNFCVKHCGPRNDRCESKKCYIFYKGGRYINLSCGKTDHGLKHFLICDAESC